MLHLSINELSTFTATGPATDPPLSAFSITTLTAILDLALVQTPPLLHDLFY